MSSADCSAYEPYFSYHLAVGKVFDWILMFQVRLMEKRVNHSEWSPNSSNEGSNHSLAIDGPGGGPPLQGDQEIIIKQLECEVEQQVREQLWLQPCPCLGVSAVALI